MSSEFDLWNGQINNTMGHCSTRSAAFSQRVSSPGFLRSAPRLGTGTGGHPVGRVGTRMRRAQVSAGRAPCDSSSCFAVAIVGAVWRWAAGGGDGRWTHPVIRGGRAFPPQKGSEPRRVASAQKRTAHAFVDFNGSRRRSSTMAYMSIWSALAPISLAFPQLEPTWSGLPKQSATASFIVNTPNSAHFHVQQPLFSSLHPASFAAAPKTEPGSTARVHAEDPPDLGYGDAEVIVPDRSGPPTLSTRARRLATCPCLVWSTTGRGFGAEGVGSGA